jgi:tetratricopeptide (TPR) repeat protein
MAKVKGGKAAVAAQERRVMRVLEDSTIEIDHQVNGAQGIAFDAMEATGKERLTLAGKALQASPLAVDAWGILASEAPDGAPFTLDLWRQAVAAGEVFIGPWRMAAWRGEFWSIIETRPYMRARQGLAFELRRQGMVAEAIDTLRGTLALNPNDNTGARYILLDWLLEAGADAEAAALHAAYEEDSSAAWHYGAVLLAFRSGGEAKAAEALPAALGNNPHVPGLLLGRVPMPAESPEYYSPGDADEATVYCETAAEGWRAAPGALDWLARAVPGEPAPPPKPRKRAKG